MRHSSLEILSEMKNLFSVITETNFSIWNFLVSLIEILRNDRFIVFLVKILWIEFLDSSNVLQIYTFIYIHQTEFWGKCKMKAWKKVLIRPSYVRFHLGRSICFFFDKKLGTFLMRTKIRKFSIFFTFIIINSIMMFVSYLFYKKSNSFVISNIQNIHNVSILPVIFYSLWVKILLNIIAVLVSSLNFR